MIKEGSWADQKHRSPTPSTTPCSAATTPLSVLSSPPLSRSRCRLPYTFSMYPEPQPATTMPSITRRHGLYLSCSRVPESTIEAMRVGPGDAIYTLWSISERCTANTTRRKEIESA